jgi:predicted nucleic acid-binding Zn ribbon protein
VWNSFQKYIPKAAGKYNFTKTLKAIEVCQAYRKIASEYLPSEAQKYTFPKAYKNNILIIGALNSSWAQQVQISSHRIHRSLDEKFGKNVVKKIKVEIAEKLPG